MRSVRRVVLDRALARASAPGGETYAAAVLPGLERTVPPTRVGAELVRSLARDERWAARYLAGRTIARLAPDHVEPDEAWEVLLALAGDSSAAVRQGAAWGIGGLVTRLPAQGERLEALLADTSARRSARKAALRSLVLLAGEPATRELAERSLDRAALSADGLARGVWVLVTRGIGRRDPAVAESILARWEASEEGALREQATRARRWPVVDAEDAAPAMPATTEGAHA